MMRSGSALAWRRQFLPWAAAVSVIAVVLFAVDPAVHRIWPVCPFYALTGWLCPLCGSLRAAHLALHGQWLPSLQANPLTWLGVVSIAVMVLIRRQLSVVRSRPLILAGLVLVTLFTVVRNLPGVWWMRPQ